MKKGREPQQKDKGDGCSNLKALELAIQSGAPDPLVAARRLVEFFTSDGNRELPSSTRPTYQADMRLPPIMARSWLWRSSSLVPRAERRL